MMTGSKINFITAMEKASLVIKALSAERIDVRGVTLVSNTPVIRVTPCAFCERMVHQGKAFYLEFGANAHGRYRQGQYMVNGCKVVWSESLH
ncbi:hypothetical protein [Citrobacter braakii]|uniref:hypothetical protein n=1 Tax=Citrobacter braakii TaxID=57706 RepID=UPI0040394FCA